MILTRDFLKSQMKNNLPYDERLKDFMEKEETVNEGFTEDEESEIMKRNYADQLEKSPLIVIISPPAKGEIIDITDLNAKYSKYLALDATNKKISNDYSTNIWGYNVPNMFDIVSRLADSQEVPEIPTNPTIDKLTRYASMVEESIIESVENRDRLGYCRTKLDLCSENMCTYHRTIFESMIKKADKDFNDYIDYLPAVVPYFTPTEMEKFCPENPYGCHIEDNYYQTISKLMYAYKASSNGEDRDRLEKEIISKGWNPNVSFTNANILFARERQAKWMRDNMTEIIDVNDLPIAVDSSTARLRDKYNELNLHPIHIILTLTGTLFSKVARKLKNYEYAHAGISLDSNLKSIFTFSFSIKERRNGFHEENLDYYKGISKDGKIMVLTLFVEKNVKDRLRDMIDLYKTKKEETGYAFKNLFDIMINHVHKTDNLHMHCSQFVDLMLRSLNIDITKKSNSLVTPNDFYLAKKPRVFKTYEGYSKDYSEKKVEGVIDTLLSNKDKSEIEYRTMMKEVCANFTLESLFYTTENEKANEILREMQDLISPKAVIMERKLPFQVKDNGDIQITKKKSLEDQYQDSHKLLTTYSNSNTKAIKRELCVMFSINATIEKKIKDMKKDDPEYKTLINLRARVLNDFKKYLKIVMEEEPNFDFGEYYKNSELNTSNLTVDKSTYKFTGSLIKNILKMKARGI